MRQLVIMNKEGWPSMDRAKELLEKEANLLDVVEESIKCSEREPGVRTVSYNSAPNALGVMQLDASCMDGDTLQTGAVGALEGFLHPISVERDDAEAPACNACWGWCAALR